MTENRTTLKTVVLMEEGQQKPGRTSNDGEARGMDINDLSSVIENIAASELVLDKKDVVVIKLLLSAVFDGKDSVKTVDVIRSIDKTSQGALDVAERVKRLRKAEIIETVKYSTDDISIMRILRSSVKITESFFNRLLGIKEAATAVEKAPLIPYENYEEYLADQFERVRLTERMNERISNFERWRAPEDGHSGTAANNLAELFQRITSRLAITRTFFPLEKFKKEKKITPEEEMVLLALLRHSICREGSSDSDDLINLIAGSSYEKLKVRKVLGPDGRLFKDNMIEEVRFLDGRRLKLEENVRRRLLGEKSRRRSPAEHEDSAIFDVIKPRTTLDNVVLHRQTLTEVSLAIEKTSGVLASRLHEWGFPGSFGKPPMRGQRMPVTMLFYGPPGTGKTLTAHAIAGTLKKEVLTFDCSRILDKWVGESQKNTRMIFDNYRELSKGKRNPPVLLLNEADQFLHRRMEVQRSVEQMYNQMQNIFLEQLESFQGVLIATTNLVGSFDAAFSRRFSHKVEFRRPGAEERLKLWNMLLPKQAPLALDVDLEKLADSYDLSGGQIAVILLNAATKAASKGDHICQADLVEAVEAEIKSNFDDKATRKVGF